MIDDLIAFLNARLDEDEAAAAKAAEADKYGGRPNWSALGNIVIDAGDPDWAVVDLSPCFEDASIGAHIVRHDPSHALRDVEAKRLLLELAWDADQTDKILDEEIAREAKPGELTTGALILRAMAAVYNDHPDYREDWKP